MKTENNSTKYAQEIAYLVEVIETLVVQQGLALQKYPSNQADVIAQMCSFHDHDPVYKKTKTADSYMDVCFCLLTLPPEFAVYTLDKLRKYNKHLKFPVYSKVMDCMININSIYESSLYGRDFVRRMVSRIDVPQSDELLKKLDDLMLIPALRAVQAAKFILRTIVLSSQSFERLKRTYLLKEIEPSIKVHLDDELSKLTSRELVEALNSNIGGVE